MIHERISINRIRSQLRGIDQPQVNNHKNIIKMEKGQKKSAAQKAAAKEAAQQNAQTKVDVIQTGDLMNKMSQMAGNKTSLSPDATVAALTGLKEMVHDRPDAAEYYGMSDDAVKKMNMFTLAGFATVLAIEVETNKSQFAQRMLEKQPEALNAISEFTGVRINIKALPAPNADGTVNVPSTAIEVSEEAKKKIKAEKAVEKTNPTTNPAEIKDESQLAASLSSLLTKSSDNIDARIKTVINFYRGYLTIKANNSEKKDEELAKVKAMTRSEMLSAIANLVGPCPFALDGHGKMFRNLMVKNNTIITPFCLYRRTSIDTAKDPVDDSFVADVIKTIILWSCDSAIAAAKKTISEYDRIIRKNEKIVEENKDKTEVTIAKSAIKTWEEQKNKPTAIIEQMTETIHMLKNPSLDEVDSLIENYNIEDASKEEYKRAHLIVDNIAKTYYKGVDITKVDKDQYLANIQQRAGIIINMFRDPLSQSINYSEANITELKEKEDDKAE